MDDVERQAIAQAEAEERDGAADSSNEETSAEVVNTENAATE
jgi:hypothetical protein